MAKKKKPEVLYPEISVKLHQGPEALRVEEAQTLLGWTEETEGEKWGSDYTLKDTQGKNIRFLNNPTNRPFRMVLAKRYASEILRRKWALNGETIVLDRLGHIQSGQHRLGALVLAEQERKKNPDFWRESYGWKGPVCLECLLVVGISEEPGVVDTLDIGQKRSLGDVIFRNQDLGGLGDRDQKQVANSLAVSTRLAWLRMGGLMVSDAPAFLHSEALDFLESHPGLVEDTMFIFNENGGSGVEGRKISFYLSLGYAGALCYLMSTARTDPDHFEETGEVDTSLREKAQEFWSFFAGGAGMEKKNPILILRNLLPKIDCSGSAGRDEVVGMVVKAWNLWIEGQEATPKDIRVRKTNDENGRKVLAEEPRMGGLDVVRDIQEEDPQE